MEENSQYLTQKQFKDGLAEFTEEVLLPAVEKIIDVKLEEKFDKKLAPIYNRLDSIENRLDAIESELHSIRLEVNELKSTLARIDKRTDEDVVAAYGEIEELKKRISDVEEQMRILQAQKA